MGHFLVFLSATGFGLLTIFASFAYESGVSVATLLFLRFAFASVIFFAYLFLRIKKWSMTRKQLLSLVFLGCVLYTLQSSFYFSSVKYISTALAALLLYLYPVFVAVLSFFVNKERLSVPLVLSMVISLFGMVFVLGSPGGNSNIIGVLLALGAAVVYSFYIVIGNRVALKVPPIITSAFIALFASVSFFIWGVFTDTLNFEFEASGWLPILSIAIFSTVVSMFCFFAGMNLTGPTKASILSMIEPVVTSVFSILLLQEKMSYPQIFGGLIVLTGAILVVVAREKAKNAETGENSPVRAEF